MFAAALNRIETSASAVMTQRARAMRAAALAAAMQAVAEKI